MDSEIQTGSKALIVWGIVIIALILIGTIAYTAILPALYQFRTEAVQHSQGYIESKQQLLYSLMEDYEDLATDIVKLGDTPQDQTLKTQMESQQAAILERIETEAKMLGSPNVPADVVEFIHSH